MADAAFIDSSSAEFRQIKIESGLACEPTAFPNNFISSGKYTILSWVPKNLFEQFNRVANIWFLIVSICQLLPFNLSPTANWATIAPLSFILSVSLFKDGYLDYRRHAMDRKINNRITKKWEHTTGKFEDVKWMDLRVGNIVLLEGEVHVPADIMLLASGHREKVCYVETTSLDGEESLKLKKCLNEISSVMEGTTPIEAMKNMHIIEDGVLKTEQPNNRLHSFEGWLKLKGYPRATPVYLGNMILQSSTLKNTPWIIGLVVFTGNDTKLMKNSKHPPHKVSNLEKKINSYLTIIFTFLFAIAFLDTAIYMTQSYSNSDQFSYFSGSTYELSPISFITFLILYNSLIPISLYITLDIVKAVQSKLIQWDNSMYYDETDMPASVKTGDLNEDLGQIEYIFTDKTGTLTENVMEFKMCSIKGKSYGFNQENERFQKCQVNPHKKFEFWDPDLLEDMQTKGKKEIGDFFELLALCNTVTPDFDFDGEPIYQAASPDEEALVIAAHCFGYSLIGYKDSSISLRINGETLEYRILGINEFSSERKRMSIVVEPMSERNRNVILLCKGADSVMLERCLGSSQDIITINKHLDEFSLSGLRTFVLGRRELTMEQANDYQIRYNTAKNALSDKAARLYELAEEFEKDMDLIGAAAVEDKIQEGVPEAIETLMEGGIKVWVLTGDRTETAVNIGYSCKLLQPDMDIIKIAANTLEESRGLIKAHLARYVKGEKNRHNSVLNKIRCVTDNTPGNTINHNHTRKNTRYQVIPDDGEMFEGDLKVKNLESLNIGLVVDGRALGFIINDPITVKYFMMLASLCHAVILCRVTPLQKSELVKIVKKRLAFKPMTLAIGDGANDVSMIQEAHIGVGICGKEGMQAANASEYVIARFAYLVPLLLIHGRWNYNRVSKVILYSFYKNFMLVLPNFYFSFINLFSGTSFYDSFLMTLYNVVFTSLPIVIVGSLDRDLSKEVIINRPVLYTDGIYKRKFNLRWFIRWSMFAVVHSGILFGFMYGAVVNAITVDGFPQSLDITGVVAFAIAIKTVNYVITVESYDWTWLFFWTSGVSILLFYPLIFWYDYSGYGNYIMWGISTKTFYFPYYIVSMMMVPVINAIHYITVKYIGMLWYPTKADSLIVKNSKVAPSKRYQMRSKNRTKLVLMRVKEYADCLNKVFIPKNVDMGANEDEDHDYYAFHNIFLQFKHPYVEKTYKTHIIQRITKFMTALARLIIILGIAFELYVIISNTGNIGVVVSYSVLLCLCFFILWFSTRKSFIRQFDVWILAFVASYLLFKFVHEVFYHYDSSLSTALVITLNFFIFNVGNYKICIINAIFLFAYLVYMAIMYSLDEDVRDALIILFNYAVLSIGIFLVSTYVGYLLEKFAREEFVFQRKLEFQFQKGQDILSNLLPNFVKDRVKEGVRYIAEKQSSVTVVFCDIYDFDKICSSLSPNELLELLDKFFVMLDGLCEKLGVTKIETVNKTYVICGGLADSEASLSTKQLKLNHAERCLEAAIKILQKLEPVSLKNGHKLQVKIGINTGSVIAGVVGEHKPQFSLVGDTVNTASRMCSTLKTPDSIQISSETYNFIRDHTKYNFIPNKVEAKGKGLLNTFIVDNQKARRKTRRAVYLGGSSSKWNGEDSIDAIDKSIEPLMAEDKRMQTQQITIEDETTKAAQKFELADLTSQEDSDLELVGPVEWLVCSFKETDIQKDFRLSGIERDLKGLIYGLWLTITTYTIRTIIFITAFILDRNQGSIPEIVLRFACLATMFYLVSVFKNVYKSSLFPWAVMLLYIIESLLSAVSIATMPSYFINVVALEIMYTNLVINHISGLPFGYILFATVINAGHWICIVSMSNVDEFMAVQSTLLILAFFAINAIISFITEWQSRKAYNLNKRAQREIKNTEKLLNQMIPPQVLRNLHNDVTTTDRYYDVTILYADIVGFTMWSSDKDPIDVVSMLSKLFSIFDHLCVRHNVYKVHTIGDCYVILGFTDGENRDPPSECLNVLEMALDMIKAIKRVNKSKKINLNMRIGIHTGEVIAGITGTNIVRYDIYGPDNDIANKMESNGFAGKINVSEIAKAIIEGQAPGRFDYDFNKVVKYEPTGRSLNSYFVVPKHDKDIVFDED
ncbi:unnamed protein product [Blepharisma stoltei]|uniref:P-type phospholipid transporter n=1 Tax=Blepharisma stoltei TaxID=1481888 RepID=A0AAU9K5C6_9CILI|nr:unnamed protein product [Blepharisma stoltei]